jgi:haloalkane dehalogenase
MNIEEFPFENHFLDRNGLDYHYLDEGEGDPVVMVHGNPSWSFYYRNLVKALSPTHRCIVPDHIGMGLSDKPGDAQYDYTLKCRVDDLETLLDHLDITTNITLVVHDWGGMIGMTYATRHPERIQRIVVLNTSAFRMPKAKGFPFGLWLSRTPIGTVLIRGFNAFSAAAARVGCKRNPLTRDFRAAYCRPYNSWQNRIATLRFVQDIPLRPGDKAWDLVVNTEKKLPLLKDKPMLICWGLKDFVFDHHFLEGWQQRFRNAEVHRFEDCGHYILEDAMEEIVPLIEKFISQA